MHDIERQQQEWGLRAREAQAKAAHAYERMLHLAETRDSGQVKRVASFLAATFNGEAFPFDLYELRALDVEISNDMLCVIDALRWGKADVHTLVPEGEKRVLRALEAWGITWPDQE